MVPGYPDNFTILLLLVPGGTEILTLSTEQLLRLVETSDRLPIADFPEDASGLALDHSAGNNVVVDVSGAPRGGPVNPGRGYSDKSLVGGHRGCGEELNWSLSA